MHLTSDTVVADRHAPGQRLRCPVGGDFGQDHAPQPADARMAARIGMANALLDDIGGVASGHAGVGDERTGALPDQFGLVAGSRQVGAGPGQQFEEARRGFGGQFGVDGAHHPGPGFAGPQVPLRQRIFPGNRVVLGPGRCQHFAVGLFGERAGGGRLWQVTGGIDDPGSTDITRQGGSLLGADGRCANHCCSGDQSGFQIHCDSPRFR